MHELAQKKLDKESGAIALLFALLISSGLVISLFVLVFDVGSIYSERRVVQNASDASVLALVQECAVDGNGGILGLSPAYLTPVCKNQANAENFAGSYANLNSPDNLTSIGELCGTSPLKPCSEQKRGLFQCGAIDPKYRNYIRIGTDSNSKDISSLKPLFSSLLNQNASVDAVGCTNAAWGKAARAPIFFPFAVPICNFPQVLPVTVVLLDYQNPINCSIVDLEGVTFNYTGVPDGLFILTEYQNALGQSIKFGCPNSNQAITLKIGNKITLETSLRQVELACGTGSQFSDTIKTFVGQKVFLPVVTEIKCSSSTTNCSNFTSLVASFVSFKFLGAIFKGNTANLIGSNPPSGWPTDCTRNAKIQVCLYGQYVKSVVPGADISTDPTFPAVGAQAVQILP
jgi:hypothetical protein